MVFAEVKVQLSIREIWDMLCPECKEKLRALIKDKVADEIVSKVAGVE